MTHLAIQLRLIFYEHFRKPDDVIFQTFSNDSFADKTFCIWIFQILALTLSAIDLVDIKELKVPMDLESKADRKTSVASSQCIRITAAARRPQQSAHIWHIKSLRSAKLTSEPQTFSRERERKREADNDDRHGSSGSKAIKKKVACWDSQQTLLI